MAILYNGEEIAASVAKMQPTDFSQSTVAEEFVREGKAYYDQTGKLKFGTLKPAFSVFIRYSAHADGTDFTEEWTEGQNYIGVATDTGAPTEKSAYTWLLVKGDKGEKGDTGGDSAFIRFSASSDGTDFTEEWTEGQNYIGVATAQTAPTEKSAYKWARVADLVNVVQTTGNSTTDAMSQKATTEELAKRYDARGFLEDGTDLDTLRENCTAMLASSRTYYNSPITEGTICVNAGSDFITQTAQNLVYGHFYYRRYMPSESTWGAWFNIGNECYLPNIEGVDMTNEILYRLNKKGTCVLGTGEYIVNFLKMPDDTTIIGQGNKTILKVTTSGASCIYAGKRCTIKDVQIVGTATSVSEGTGAGVAVMPAEDTSIYNIKIDNCQIHHFGLAGIHVEGTGYWCANSMTVSNCEIYSCHRGLSIGIHSEYSRYTNILTRDCYFGCYNMGGNNVFVNCTFSNSQWGAYLPCHTDGTINNGHGSFIGCTFNHNGNNEGYAVVMNTVTNGFIFSGCQFWYGKMLIENCEGIVFDGCQFGGALELTTWSNTLCMFANSVFSATPTLVGAASARKFVNCWLDTGAAISE